MERSKINQPLDVLLLAGGRVSGPYAERIGTDVKALALVGGVPVVRRVVLALRDSERVGSVCVVGPESVRDVVRDLAAWEPETGTALGNLEAGVRHLDAGHAERLLLSGTDVPLLSAPALDDFLSRAQPEADICMPVIRRESFVRQFPDGQWVYVRMADGAFTGGSQFLIRPSAVLANLPLIRRMFENRKSQLGMARALGMPFVLKLLTRRLRIAELEARASALTGCRCRAVPDCHPALAFDLDNVEDLLYAERQSALHSRAFPADSPDNASAF